MTYKQVPNKASWKIFGETKPLPSGRKNSSSSDVIKKNKTQTPNHRTFPNKQKDQPRWKK